MANFSLLLCNPDENGASGKIDWMSKSSGWYRGPNAKQANAIPSCTNRESIARTLHSIRKINGRHDNFLPGLSITFDLHAMHWRPA